MINFTFMLGWCLTIMFVVYEACDAIGLGML